MNALEQAQQYINTAQYAKHSVGVATPTLRICYNIAHFCLIIDNK
jgi:hypothetical protein